MGVDMYISGWAFKEESESIRDGYRARYEEIKNMFNDLDMRRSPSYGKGSFIGTLRTEEEKKLSELDLCLLADSGNLCFGGYCEISGDKFHGAYYKD